MPNTTPDLHFQAAVERPLSLAFRDHGGTLENHDCTVTVVAERKGLDDADVVIDFRLLEAELDKALEPFQGSCVDEPLGAAKKIAEVLAPSVAPPARLACVSIRDEAGRRVTSVMTF